MTGSLRHDIKKFPDLRGGDADAINTHVYWFNRLYLLCGIPSSKEHGVPKATFHKYLVDRLVLHFVPDTKKDPIAHDSFANATRRLGPEYKGLIRFRPEARYLKQLDCITYGHIWRGGTHLYELCANPNKGNFPPLYVRSKLTERMKEAIKTRDGNVCQQSGCGCNNRSKLEVHHIMPVSKGGDNSPGNLITLCKRHNQEISNNWIPVALNPIRPMVLSW